MLKSIFFYCELLLSRQLFPKCRYKLDGLNIFKFYFAMVRYKIVYSI